MSVPFLVGLYLTWSSNNGHFAKQLFSDDMYPHIDRNGANGQGYDGGGSYEKKLRTAMPHFF